MKYVTKDLGEEETKRRIEGNCVEERMKNLHEGEMKNPHAGYFDDVGNRDFALEPWNWDPDCIVDPDGRTECDERFNLAIE